MDIVFWIVLGLSAVVIPAYIIAYKKYVNLKLQGKQFKSRMFNPIWTILVCTVLVITFGMLSLPKSADNKKLVTINIGTSTEVLSFDENAEITIPSPEKEGYEFINWYTDAACNTLFDSNSFKASGETSVNLYAKWEKIPAVYYDVTIGDYITNYYCSSISGVRSYEAGTELELYSENRYDECLVVDYWVVNGEIIDSGNDYQNCVVTINGDMTVSVVYKYSDDWTDEITFINCQVIGYTGELFCIGNTYQVEAVIPSGYLFDGWKINGAINPNLTLANTTFTVNGGMSVEAVAAKTYTVTLDDNCELYSVLESTGYAVPVSNDGNIYTFKEGDKILISAISPSDNGLINYNYDSWTVNGEIIETNFTTHLIDSITEDYVIGYNYEKQNWNPLRLTIDGIQNAADILFYGAFQKLEENVYKVYPDAEITIDVDFNYPDFKVEYIKLNDEILDGICFTAPDEDMDIEIKIVERTDGFEMYDLVDIYQGRKQLMQEIWGHKYAINLFEGERVKINIPVANFNQNLVRTLEYKRAAANYSTSYAQDIAVHEFTTAEAAAAAYALFDEENWLAGTVVVDKFIVVGGAEWLKDISSNITENDGFYYIPKDDGTSKLYRYLGNEAELWISSSLVGENRLISEIGDYAFSAYPEDSNYGGINLINYRSPVSIVLGTSVTTVEEYAFDGCVNLNTVRSSVDFTVGASAFKNCANLEIVPWRHITSIGNAAFFNCASLKSITLREDIAQIGMFAFGGCYNVTYLDVPYIGLDSTVNGSLTSWFNKGIVFNAEEYEDFYNIETIVYRGADYAHNAFSSFSNLETLVFTNAADFYSSTAQMSQLKNLYLSENFVASEMNFNLCENANIHFAVSEIPAGWDIDWNKYNSNPDNAAEFAYMTEGAGERQYQLGSTYFD